MTRSAGLYAPDGSYYVTQTNGSGGLGASSGITASATFTPAAATYSAATLMDVAKQFNFTMSGSGLAIPTGSLIRILTTFVKIDITAVPSGQTSYSLYTYGVTPPSAQADQAAWAMASTDLATYRGKVSLGTPVDLGSSLVVKTNYQDFDIKLDTGLSSIFGELVTDGGHTAAAVARTIVLYGIIL